MHWIAETYDNGSEYLDENGAFEVSLERIPFLLILFTLLKPFTGVGVCTLWSVHVRNDTSLHDCTFLIQRFRAHLQGGREAQRGREAHKHQSS